MLITIINNIYLNKIYVYHKIINLLMLTLMLIRNLLCHKKIYPTSNRRFFKTIVIIAKLNEFFKKEELNILSILK